MSPTGLVCFYGLDLFWAYVQDQPSVAGTPEDTDEAIGHIVALVEFVDGRMPDSAAQSLLYTDTRARSSALGDASSGAAGTALRLQILQRCLDNVESNSSVPQSLKLMTVR